LGGGGGGGHGPSRYHDASALDENECCETS